MAFFEGLVVDHDGRPAEVVRLGDATYYVIDDSGFRRHVDARDVDRVVLQQLVDQLGAHKEEAAAALLRVIGQEDLFSKAMVDSTLRNIDVEQLLAHELPADMRQWLGMMGFQVVINHHGEITRLEMPGVESEENGEEDP
jgi:hypothetical protein